MFQLHTATISSNPDPMECHLTLVLNALRQKGMLPSQPPTTPLSDVLTPASLQHFTLERESDGWTYVITFEPREVGMPNATALPAGLRTSNPMSAFLIGAQLICKIVTGSTDLPFFAVGNKLMFGTYGPASPAPVQHFLNPNRQA